MSEREVPDVDGAPAAEAPATLLPAAPEVEAVVDAPEAGESVPEVAAADAPETGDEARHGAADGDEPPFRIAYQLTADAAMDATRLVTGDMRRRMTYVALGAVAAGVVITLLGEWVFGPMVAIFGLMTYAMWTMRAPERWLLSRRFRGMLDGPSVIEIGEGGLDLSNPRGNGQVPWWAVHDIRANERTVVFLRQEGIVAFAPAEAFGSPARLERIVAFAKARVRPRT